MSILDSAADRARPLLETLARSQWIPQLLVRLFVGYFFFETGWAKAGNLDAMTGRFTGWGIPFPAFNAALSAYTELVGGALLVLGLGTRLAAIPLWINMVVAILVVNIKKVGGLDDFVELSEPLYALCFVWLFFSGPGRVSLDHLLSQRLMRVGALTGLLFVFAATAPVAAGALPPPPALDAMMDRLIHDEPAFRELGLAEVSRLGHPAAVPGLIDVLYFDLFLDSRVANLLDRLTGQGFGHDWRQWVEWLQKQPTLRPHRDYAAWKGRLLARIDPAFAQFLPPGVKHRVRVEEIVWGGVRKDAIPALTNPRHVRPAQATYLTHDELVLGLSVGGEHRAYPLRIMDWHEMANDVVGGVPLTIAY